MTLCGHWQNNNKDQFKPNCKREVGKLFAFWNKNAQAVLTSIVCEQQLILCCQSGLMTVIYMSLFRLSLQLQKFHHSQLWEKSELWD